MENYERPDDLHARLSVVEDNTKRLDGDLKQIWGKVTNLEVCASSLPKIETSMLEIVKKVDDLRISIACRDAEVKTEYDLSKKNKPFLEKWQIYIAPILSSVITGLVAVGLIMYLHVFK
jgi:hypothetical protein